VPACKWVYRFLCFSLPAFQTGGDYDVSLDGRFLVHIMDTEQAPRSVTVILNWARRLKM